MFLLPTQMPRAWRRQSYNSRVRSNRSKHSLPRSLPGPAAHFPPLLRRRRYLLRMLQLLQQLLLPITLLMLLLPSLRWPAELLRAAALHLLLPMYLLLGRRTRLLYIVGTKWLA